MDGPLKRLSRAMPHLTFRLMIHCLDDSSPSSFEIKAGRARKRSFREAEIEAYWDLARKKFKLAGDDVYGDDEAELFTEERLREDVLNLWEPAGVTRRRREWWNRPTSRDLIDEMYLMLV